MRNRYIDYRIAADNLPADVVKDEVRVRRTAGQSAPEAAVHA